MVAQRKKRHRQRSSDNELNGGADSPQQCACEQLQPTQMEFAHQLCIMAVRGQRRGRQPAGPSSMAARVPQSLVGDTGNLSEP